MKRRSKWMLGSAFVRRSTVRIYPTPTDFYDSWASSHHLQIYGSCSPPRPFHHSVANCMSLNALSVPPSPSLNSSGVTYPRRPRRRTSGESWSLWFLHVPSMAWWGCDFCSLQLSCLKHWESGIEGKTERSGENLSANAKCSSREFVSLNTPNKGWHIHQ